MIAPKLTHLNNLPYTAVELRQEAANRAKKLSIQGVQPKLSASVSIVDQEFKIVDQFGTYIIKPQNDLFPQLPENEDVTMRMAKAFGLDSSSVKIEKFPMVLHAPDNLGLTRVK